MATGQCRYRAPLPLQKVLMEEVIWEISKLSGEGRPRWGLGQPWDIHEGIRYLEEMQVIIQIGHHDSCSLALGLLTTDSLGDLGQCILFL